MNKQKLERPKLTFGYDMIGLWSFINYPLFELMIVTNEVRGTGVFIWDHNTCEMILLE